jgi:hypothetical protein
MLQREQAWTFEGVRSDLWSKDIDETGETMEVKSHIMVEDLH